MASEDSGTITTRIVEPAQQVNFLAENKEFAAQVKALKHVNKAAIEKLENLLLTVTDTTLLLKCIEIATRLSENAVKNQANDNLQKMVAQARLGVQGNSKQLVNAPEDSRPKVSVDFTQIRSLD